MVQYQQYQAGSAPSSPASLRTVRSVGLGVLEMTGVRMTDRELTQAYETYRDMVYRIAFVKTKSKAQAEDIQQEVFLALVRYSDRIRDGQHLNRGGSYIAALTWACKLTGAAPEQFTYVPENDVTPGYAAVAREAVANALKNPVEIKIDAEKVQTWLKNGAQPTDTVRALIAKSGNQQ